MFTQPLGALLLSSTKIAVISQISLWDRKVIDEDKRRKGQDKLGGIRALNCCTLHRLALCSESLWQEGFVRQLKRLDGVRARCSVGIRRRVASFTFNQTLPIRSDYNRISKLGIILSNTLLKIHPEFTLLTATKKSSLFKNNKNFKNRLDNTTF